MSTCLVLLLCIWYAKKLKKQYPVVVVIIHGRTCMCENVVNNLLDEYVCQPTILYGALNLDNKIYQKKG